MLNKSILILGAVIVALSGTITSCDVLEPSQRFTVTYEVSGTFSDCTVFYITRRDDLSPEEVNKVNVLLDINVNSLLSSIDSDMSHFPYFVDLGLNEKLISDESCYFSIFFGSIFQLLSPSKCGDIEHSNPTYESALRYGTLSRATKGCHKVSTNSNNYSKGDFA